MENEIPATQSKPKSPMQRVPRKFLLVGVGIVAIILIGAAIFVTMRPGEKNLKSQGGKIELHEIAPGMTLKENATASGTLTPEKDTTLYYTVSSEDKRVLGAGNILPGEGNNFSRNLTFDAKDYKGKKGQLQVYLQDKSGKLIDNITTEVTFE